MTPQANGTLNPFAPLSPRAATLRDMLASRIAESEPSLVWQDRARDLAASIAPLLAWAELKGAYWDSSEVKALLQFDTLVTLGDQTAVLPRIEPRDLSCLPVSATEGIRDYLAGLPGYEPGRPSPENSQARQIHGYALCALRQHLAELGQNAVAPHPTSSRGRQAGYTARLRTAGLAPVAVWVPVKHAARIHAEAARLRAEAGLLLPVERDDPAQPSLFPVEACPGATP